MYATKQKPALSDRQTKTTWSGVKGPWVNLSMARSARHYDPRVTRTGFFHAGPFVGSDGLEPDCGRDRIWTISEQNPENRFTVLDMQAPPKPIVAIAFLVQTTHRGYRGWNFGKSGRRVSETRGSIPHSPPNRRYMNSIEKPPNGNSPPHHRFAPDNGAQRIVDKKLLTTATSAGDKLFLQWKKRTVEGPLRLRAPIMKISDLNFEHPVMGGIEAAVCPARVRNPTGATPEN